MLLRQCFKCAVPCLCVVLLPVQVQSAVVAALTSPATCMQLCRHRISLACLLYIQHCKRVVDQRSVHVAHILVPVLPLSITRTKAASLLLLKTMKASPAKMICITS